MSGRLHSRCALIAAVFVLNQGVRAADVSYQFFNTGAYTQTSTSAGGYQYPSDIVWSVKPPSSSDYLAPIVANPAAGWAANTSTSKWLSNSFYYPSYQAGETDPGQYRYRHLFDVSGYLRKTFVLTGRRMMDDGTEGIVVNNTQVGSESPGTGGWTNFTVSTTDAVFMPTSGDAWIEWRVGNVSGPSGFRLEWTSATATPVPTAGTNLTLPAVTVNEGSSASLPFTLAATTSNASHPYNLSSVNVTFTTSGTSGTNSRNLTASPNALSTTFNPSFTWADEGAKSVTAVGTTSEYVTTDSAYTASPAINKGFVVNVLNVAPTLTSSPASGSFNWLQSPNYSFGASAFDPGVLDVLTYRWDLDGDGQFDDFTGASGAFNYTGFAAGLYHLGVQVDDGDGGVDTRTFNLDLVPEPATFGMLVAAAAMPFLRRQKSARRIPSSLKRGA